MSLARNTWRLIGRKRSGRVEFVFIPEPETVADLTGDVANDAEAVPLRRTVARACLPSDYDLPAGLRYALERAPGTEQARSWIVVVSSWRAAELFELDIDESKCAALEAYMLSERAPMQWRSVGTYPLRLDSALKVLSLKPSLPEVYLTLVAVGAKGGEAL